jgi:hypothetical protein
MVGLTTYVYLVGSAVSSSTPSPARLRYKAKAREVRTRPRTFPRPQVECCRAVQLQHLVLCLWAAGRWCGGLARPLARDRARI